MKNMVNNKAKYKRGNKHPTIEALIGCAMLPKSFTTLCSALDDKKERSKKRKHHTPNERSDVAQKNQKGPASLFGREAEVLFGA